MLTKDRSEEESGLMRSVFGGAGRVPSGEMEIRDQRLEIRD